MPTTRHRLTVAKSTPEEYWGLNLYLQILDDVHEKKWDYDEPYDMMESIKEDFEGRDGLDSLNLDDVSTTDWDDFYSDLLGIARGIRYECAIFNLDVLMTNCADPEDDTLNFNKKINDAFELSDKVERERFSLKRRKYNPRRKIK